MKAFLIALNIMLLAFAFSVFLGIYFPPYPRCPEYRVPAFKVVGTQVWHMNAVPIDSVIFGTWKQVEGSTIIKQ